VRAKGAFARGGEIYSSSLVMFKIRDGVLRYNSGYGWKDLGSIKSRHKAAWLWGEIFKNPEDAPGRGVALSMVDGHGLALDEAKGLSNWPFILAERLGKENIEAPEHSFAQLEIVHFRGGAGAYAPTNWGGIDMVEELEMVLAYVPDAENYTWQEAVGLAHLRDEQAALELASQFEE
jgi:hypothetical protein